MPMPAHQSDLVTSPSCIRTRGRVMLSGCARSITCRTGQHSRASTGSSRTPGISSHIRHRWPTHIRGDSLRSKQNIVTTIRRGAHFYSDLFSRSEATNFRGRDKELSPLTSQTFKIGASYEFISDPEGWNFIKRGTAKRVVFFAVSRLSTNSQTSALGAPLGAEPLYQLEADIIQVFFSFWY